MKKLLKWIGLLLLVLIAAVATFIFSPSVQLLVLQSLAPDHDFSADHAVDALDYNDLDSWLAHPDKADNADWSPQGTTVTDPDTAKVHVFFIHPTAYLGNAHWNGNFDKPSGTDENKQWMATNLASAFNGCCSVYAPYFREATIHAFMQDDLSNGGAALGFAYQDVARAFTQFIDSIPAGSPFIVASHSQGTVHGQRLVQERIDGTPLVERLVAAYLIGCTIHEDLFADHYEDIAACSSADDLHCVIAYDTWGPDGDPNDMSCPNWAGDEYVRDSSKWLCVNPLSWHADEQAAPAAQNPGSVPVQNRYNLSVFGKDNAKGLTWGSLEAPLPGLASAQCEDGILRANDQGDGPFSRLALNGNYHGLDYALYYMSIRENARHRTGLWWQRK